jgi:deoxyadenosine/deoxycytidine kinase
MFVRKFLPISCDVIVVDGLWGVGKTALTATIGAMKNVEKMKLEHVHEYACTMHHLGKMSDDAARFMLLTYADIDQYSNLIGREVNFRPKDASGTRNTTGSTFTYLRRLFQEDGDQIVDLIQDKNIAHHVVTHQVLPVGEPMFDAFSDRLKMIHIVRHPVHLTRYWNDYLSDFLRHREFTVSFDVDGHKVPWWAETWADQFITMNTMDRALASISHLYELLVEAFSRHQHDNRLLVVSFEDLVMRPQETFPNVARFLGRELGSKTDKILKRERIPRPTITHGRAFSAHNWATSGNTSEQEVYDLEMQYVYDHGSATVVDRFRETIRSYNKLWPSELNAFEALGKR